MNKKIIILQIGRLDKNIEQSIKFKYKDKVYDYPLSSLALREYLKDEKEDVKLCLLYPVSLPLNEIFRSSINSQDEKYKAFFTELSNLVQDSNLQHQYLKDPYKLFSKHPYSIMAKNFLVIHSLGNYLNHNFTTNLHDIVLYIWTHLIDLYLTDGFKEIYIDISSGLNFHITALLEALRYFCVWCGLFNLWGESIKAYINYTDPIIGNSSSTINIYNYEINFKYFFKTPITKQLLVNGLSKRVIEEKLQLDRHTKKEVNKYLEEFLLVYSCFANACPLYLFMRSFHETENIICQIIKIIGTIQNKYKENWSLSPEFNFEDFSKLLLSFAFFHGLKKIIKCKKYENKKEASLNDIKDFAEGLKTLGLNIQESFLKTEIYNNFEFKEFDDKYKENETEWMYLKDILKYKENNTSSIDERNFFAHAGFERTVTMVKKINSHLIVKYDEDKLDEIKNILLERAI